MVRCKSETTKCYYIYNRIVDYFYAMFLYSRKIYYIFTLYVNINILYLYINISDLYINISNFFKNTYKLYFFLEIS